MEQLECIPMTAVEARACIAGINAHLHSARALLLELYERNGWQALGYASWRECVIAEFQQSKTHLYRQLEAAQVERNISPIGEIGVIPEGQLRPLTHVEPEQQPVAWERAQEIAEEAGTRLTARHVQTAVEEVTGRHKPKENRAGSLSEPHPFDACQTPPHAIAPLLPYLPMDWMIWEPACGEGILVEAFCAANRKVISSDILNGHNFFTYEPDGWDCIVTNPPYSIKYKWLERCYQLGRPFALLLPVETLGAKQAQDLFIEHGLQVMLPYGRINFKMPNKGWKDESGKSSAQFPVAWFTWGFNLETQIVFVRLPAPPAWAA